MIQYTEQLNQNIANMKNIPGILDVQVSEPEDFITQQTIVSCLKFKLIGSHGSMELYVPKDLCMNVVAPITDEMVQQWTAPLKDGYVKQYTFETITRRFIDVENENFNQLDGGVTINTLSDEQQTLVNNLIAIDGIGAVTLKNVVDPDLKELANCSSPILVCCTPEDISKGVKYTVLVTNYCYTDTTSYDSLVENIKSLM
jgi:hypothetical protein